MKVIGEILELILLIFMIGAAVATFNGWWIPPQSFLNAWLIWIAIDTHMIRKKLNQ